MESSTRKTEQNEKERVMVVDEKQVEELLESLPKQNWMGSKNLKLVKFQDFWFPSLNLSGILNFQAQFEANPNDLMVASSPKTGTTWLKSLLFSVVNRSLHPPKQSPLLTHNPHELVYDLETGVYGGLNPDNPRPHQLNQLPSPRLLHSHLPYPSLPQSIKSSDTFKIVYICRNPFDTLISYWNFYPKLFKSLMGDQHVCRLSLQDFFEDFCNGTTIFGPFFEHVVGYWKQSLECPNKVLFLKFEDLKENPTFYVKKLADFVGMPFSPLEENEGVIQEIIDLCSITNLKELEVNKSSSSLNKFVENKIYFGEGKVGGWTRHFTTSMVNRMNKLMELKLSGTGLSFHLHPI